MAERGVQVDHATLNRWVVKYSPDIAKRTQFKKPLTVGSWRMDETYIKVKDPLSANVSIRLPVNGRSIYQKDHPPDIGLQGFLFSGCHTRWY